MVARSPGRSRKWNSAAARRLLSLAPGATTVHEAVRVVVARLVAEDYRPPTDLERAGAALGVVGCEARADLPVPGRLVQGSGGLVVEYADTLPRGRVRFTVAHELGHALFAKTGPGCPTYGSELERLCDMLATELLMPAEQFLARLSQPWSVPTIFALAREFDSSIASTAIRCIELTGVGSVFQATSTSVAWSFGPVRKGAVSAMPRPIREAVQAGLVGGRQQIAITEDNGWAGLWTLDSAPLGDGALFLLRPVRPLQRRSTLPSARVGA